MLLKPHHIFNHKGYSYIINIENMSSSILSDKTARLLTNNSSDIIKFCSEEELKKLDLITDDNKKCTSHQIEPHPVINLSLFLTQACNLRCIYCYGDGGTYGKSGFMDKKTAFQAVNWLLEQSKGKKQVHIGFFGGEPFLNYSLMKEVVNYAKKRTAMEGKIVSFSTTSNATLFDDDIIEFIKKEGISIVVSIDGPKKIQDVQRPYTNGKGSYDSILPNIKKLLNNVPETLGHAVIVGNTDPALVKNALLNIGFKEISFASASKPLYDNSNNTELHSRDISQLTISLEKETANFMTAIRIKDILSLKKFKNASELYQAVLSLLNNIKRRHACGAGLGMMAVSTTGDVYLCHRFVGQSEYKLGNIFDELFDRKSYNISPTTYNEKCSGCFAKYYCAGGCKYDNAAACGSILTPPKDMCHLRCRELELAATIVSNLSKEERGFLVDHAIFPSKPCPLDF